MTTIKVLRNTPEYRKGQILKPVTVNTSWQGFYGLDKKNKFHTEDFFKSKPHLFEFVN